MSCRVVTWDAVGVLFREVGDDAHLRRVHRAERDLDAEHARRVEIGVRALGQLAVRQLLRFDAVVALAIVVALPVGAAAEARLGEDLLIDLALLAQLDLGLELVDLAGPILADLPLEFVLPSH